MRERGRLVAVHAHPDDETLFTGGTLATYARRGVEVTLVMCTDGGGTDDEGRRLAAVRVDELRHACRILGVANIHLLNFADSGYHDDRAQQEPAAFVNQDPAHVAGVLLEIIRSRRPHVVVTYNSRGIYGHLDHVCAHERTVEAVRRAADEHVAVGSLPPWSVGATYFSVLPKLAVEREWLPVLLDHEPPYDEEEDAVAALLEQWGVDETAVAAAIDVEDATAQKYEALAVYESQRSHLEPLLLREHGRPRFEYYEVLDAGPAQSIKTDLFADLSSRTRPSGQ